MRGAGIEPYAAGNDEPKSNNADEVTPLNISSFSTARPCFVINSEPRKKIKENFFSIVYPTINYKIKGGIEKKKHRESKIK